MIAFSSPTAPAIGGPHPRTLHHLGIRLATRHRRGEMRAPERFAGGCSRRARCLASPRGSHERRWPAAARAPRAVAPLTSIGPKPEGRSARPHSPRSMWPRLESRGHGYALGVRALPGGVARGERLLSLPDDRALDGHTPEEFILAAATSRSGRRSGRPHALPCRTSDRSGPQTWPRRVPSQRPWACVRELRGPMRRPRP